MMAIRLLSQEFIPISTIILQVKGLPRVPVESMHNSHPERLSG